MAKKADKKIDLNNLKPEEELKYEIASELGYLDKVLTSGWKSLTAKESGRIGGIMTKRKREEKKQNEQAKENNQATS
ncbi:MAG: small, acid-soluble spore protein, alpha/beta type [Clostridiales bacterium]|nr:small, acid-soluble spore protein, alpha/beta type [Clostridiales bacterium]